MNLIYYILILLFIKFALIYATDSQRDASGSMQSSGGRNRAFRVQSLAQGFARVFRRRSQEGRARSADRESQSRSLLQPHQQQPSPVSSSFLSQNSPDQSQRINPQEIIPSSENTHPAASSQSSATASASSSDSIAGVAELLEQKEKCMICLEDLNLQGKFVKLNCGHRWHATCIANSLSKSGHFCPVCRSTNQFSSQIDKGREIMAEQPATATGEAEFKIVSKRDYIVTIHGQQKHGSGPFKIEIPHEAKCGENMAPYVMSSRGYYEIHIDNNVMFFWPDKPSDWDELMEIVALKVKKYEQTSAKEEIL